MATRRLNFLNRVKIQQQDIRIRLDVNGPVKRFRAELQLGEYKFPPDARICVEAKQLLETIRYEAGTIESPVPATFHDCSRLRGERIIFNVLVLDAETARILGSASAVRPLKPDDQEDENSIPLLPVDASGRVSPLVWQIDYTDTDQEGHSDAPVLKVDSDAAKQSAAFFMQDPTVRALVLPSAMREVLTRVLVIDRSEYDPESRSWRSSWIRFATRLAGEEPPDPDAPNGIEEADVWIGRAVSALADRGQLFSAYLKERPE